MFRDTKAELGPRSSSKDLGRSEFRRTETKAQQESLDVAGVGSKEQPQGIEREPWGPEMQAESEKTVTELAATTTKELAQLPGIPPLQRKQLAEGEFSQVVEQETQNAVGFGAKLKRIAAPIVAGVGIGVAARIVAKRVVDVVAPGSSVAVGGFAGAAIGGINAYRKERARVKGVKEYLKQSEGSPAVELAAQYVTLSRELSKNPVSLEKQLRLLELAEQIHAADLKEVKGADLILKDIKIRNAADTEALSGDKQNKEILDQLQAHYSTKANRATIAKAAARGAVLGSLGSVLGTAAAAYLGLGAEAVAHAEGLKQAASAAKESVPDVLPMHGTVWGTAKEFLRSQGIETNNKNILQAVKHLTGTNDIDVAAWGEHGRSVSDTGIQEGFSLKGFHEVLETFGKAATETATETNIVNAAGQVVTEHGTVLTAETIQNSVEASNYAATATTGGRGALLGKLALLAGLVGAGGYALYKWERSIPGGTRPASKAKPSTSAGSTGARPEAGPGPTTPPGSEAGPTPGGRGFGAEAAGAAGAAAGAAGARDRESRKKKDRGYDRRQRQEARAGQAAGAAGGDNAEKQRAEDEARRQAEQERQRAEDEKRRNDEKQKAEEEKRKADAEQQRQREYEARASKDKREKEDRDRKEAEEKRKEREAKDKAEQERQKAEREAQQRAENEAKAREAEAKKQAEQKSKGSGPDAGKEQKKPKLKKIPDFDPHALNAEFEAHKLLGLQYGAAKETIEKTRKQMARKNHPDLWPEDAKLAEQNMKNINRAADYLLDRFKRGGGARAK